MEGMTASRTVFSRSDSSILTSGARPVVGYPDAIALLHGVPCSDFARNAA
ncbi:MAG TPA: hypothetical protein VGN34_01800 [Ktedonobacteraceae bacterium]